MPRESDHRTRVGARRRARTEERFDATAAWLLDDLVQSIDGALEGITDPVLRLGMGIRLGLRRAEEDRPWAAFMSKFLHGADAVAGSRGDRELRRGLRLKQLHAPSADAARDLLFGTWRQAMERIASHPELSNYADGIATLMLQGLAVDRARIQEILDHPLPRVRATRTIA